MKTVYTIGHSVKPIEKFLNELLHERVTLVVDTRSIPRSRFNPHFNQKALAASLLENGIKYLARGENLGGKLENVGYDEAINELVKLSKKETIAIMCSEKDYRKCHRHTMIEPSLREKGLEIRHI